MYSLFCPFFLTVIYKLVAIGSGPAGRASLYPFPVSYTFASPYLYATQYSSIISTLSVFHERLALYY
jgi:hypothetical protein